MYRRIIQAIVRHLFAVSGLAVYLSTHGVEEDDINLLIASITVLIGIVWSIFDKFKDEKEKIKVTKVKVIPEPKPLNEKVKYNE